MVDQDLQHSSTFTFNGISLCIWAFCGSIQGYYIETTLEKREDKIFQRKCQ